MEGNRIKRGLGQFAGSRGGLAKKRGWCFYILNSIFNIYIHTLVLMVSGKSKISTCWLNHYHFFYHDYCNVQLLNWLSLPVQGELPPVNYSPTDYLLEDSPQENSPLSQQIAAWKITSRRIAPWWISQQQIVLWKIWLRRIALGIIAPRKLSWKILFCNISLYVSK